MSETQTRRLGTIRTGEKTRECPVTGDRYRVTKWVDRGEGRITALEKERLGDGDE